MCTLPSIIIVLFQLVTIYSIGATSNKEPIIISKDDEANYNKNKLLMVFDLNCIDSQINQTNSENIYNFNENKIHIEETEWLQGNIDYLMHRYPSKLSNCTIGEHNNYNNENDTIGTLHIENQKLSFVFFNYVYNNDDDDYVFNIMDYPQLCVDYITYEPTVTLQQHTCHQTHISNNERDRKYGLDLITSVNYEQTYSYPNTTDNKIDLYILDTGISSFHDEFISNNISHIIGNGDVHGHGTHVAGIVTGHNYGISPELNIFDYRVCNDDNKTCNLSAILWSLQDIMYKLKHNERRGVINLSLGGQFNQLISEFYDGLFADIITYGGIVVVAAGNSNDDACDYMPSHSAHAITVGSFDKNRRKSRFSNRGECVNVFAPGTNVYSSHWDTHRGNGYGFLSGTSMAAPYIAGVVANLLMVNNDLTFDTLNKILLNGAGIVIDGGCDRIYECYGAVYNCNAVWDNNNSEWEPPVYSNASVYEVSDDEIKWIIIGVSIGVFVCLAVGCFIWGYFAG